MLRVLPHGDEVVADASPEIARLGVVKRQGSKTEFGMSIERAGEGNLVPLAHAHRGGIAVDGFRAGPEGSVSSAHRVVSSLHQVIQSGLLAALPKSHGGGERQPR